ncbi:MAG: DNA-binding protein [Clostridia bacterium]|nr:DNA-binding protein [Clostridia bacterium]
MNVDTMVRLGALLDVYGGMLTTRQRDILKCYLCNDEGLSEIADAFHTSRQAVMDIVKRAIARLEDLEAKLQFSKKLANTLDKIPHICNKYSDSLGAETNNLCVELTHLLKSLGG